MQRILTIRLKDLEIINTDIDDEICAKSTDLEWYKEKIRATSALDLIETMGDHIDIGFPKISCVIIAKDEERCIKRCIKSIEKCVDEIILIDTGSIDSTVSIAKRVSKGKVNIFNTEWDNDFSQARNYGLMKATYDWIFIIDADEWLEYEDEDILRKVARLFAQDYKDVVLCPSIINHDKHKICSLGRFFNATNKYFYYGKVHEQIRKSKKAYGRDIHYVYTNITLYHDGYLPRIMQDKNKDERNCKLLKQQILEEPNNPIMKLFYIRDYLQVLPLEEIERYIREISYLIDCKTYEKEKIWYQVCMTNVLLEKNFQDKNYDRVKKLAHTLGKIMPNNSNSLYYNTMCKLHMGHNLSRSLLITLLNRIIDYQVFYTESQYGMIHSEGYHLDYLIYEILTTIGFDKEAEKYLTVLEKTTLLNHL